VSIHNPSLILYYFTSIQVFEADFVLLITHCDIFNPLSLFHVFVSVCVQAEWVALNYVPFAERSLEVLVDLYHKTACHKAVITEKVLQNIIKVLSKRTSQL